MNSMESALVEAGVPVPTLKARIWRIVKDNPGITHRTICQRHKAMREGTVSSSLHSLVISGDLYTKGTKGFGPSGSALAYYTDKERYEVVRKARVKSEAQDTPAPSGPPPTVDIPTIGRFVQPTANDDTLIDNMTVGQARLLYRRLHKMFGGAA